MKRLSKKFNFKRYGLFRIKKKVVTSNYELDLPANIKVRIKVFYILLLEPALKGVPLEKKIEIDADEDKYDIEEVINLRKGKNTFKYLVKWLDCGSESNLWELVKNFKCLDLITEFYRKNLN